MMAKSNRRELQRQLLAAIRTAKPAVVGRLARAEPSLVNAGNTHGNVPLGEAIATGNLNLVKLLIEHGADPHHCNHGGHNLLDVAVFSGQQAIGRYLIGLGVEPSVHHLAGLGEVGKLQTMIAGNSDLLGPTRAGGRWYMTPLHAAVQAGALEAVGYLLAVGALVDARNHNDHTPLALVPECSAAERRPPIATLLLDRAADPNALAGHHGGTVLHRAIMNGDAVLARLLLDRGADPNRQDWSGKTPLHHAVAQNRDLVALILEYSPEPGIKSLDGVTALEMARRMRKKALLELFETAQR